MAREKRPPGRPAYSGGNKRTNIFVKPTEEEMRQAPPPDHENKPGALWGKTRSELLQSAADDDAYMSLWKRSRRKASDAAPSSAPHAPKTPENGSNTRSKKTGPKTKADVVVTESDSVAGNTRASRAKAAAAASAVAAATVTPAPAKAPVVALNAAPTRRNKTATHTSRKQNAAVNTESVPPPHVPAAANTHNKTSARDTVTSDGDQTASHISREQDNTAMHAPIPPPFFPTPTNTRNKRSARDAGFVESDTDESDIDVLPPPKNKGTKAGRKPKPSPLGRNSSAINEPDPAQVSKKTSATKKQKVGTAEADSQNEISYAQDMAHNDHDPPQNALDGTLNPQEGNIDQPNDDGDDDGEKEIVLIKKDMSLSKSIVHPVKDAHLIAQAKKIGDEVYNDDEKKDLPGQVKGIHHPEWFRNVRWGSASKIDSSGKTPFVQNHMDFTQFVRGRYERMPDGTVRDQKQKLVVRFIDNNGKQRIFCNPPPKDWTNQGAITALNNRTVQQIRRNTNVRFRDIVVPYIEAESAWIAQNLDKNGKPTQPWAEFTATFNKNFAGQIVAGSDMPRPTRSQSSLSKEIDRFRGVYTSGAIPKRGQGKGEAVGAKQSGIRLKITADRIEVVGVKGGAGQKRKRDEDDGGEGASGAKKSKRG